MIAGLRLATRGSWRAARAEACPTGAAINEFRERYLLGYAPEGVAPGGWHTIEVRVPGKTFSIQARTGYSRDGTTK